MKTLHELTIRLVKKRLDYFHNNRTETAKSMGIALRTLRHWIKREPELQKYRLLPGKGEPFHG